MKKTAILFLFLFFHHLLAAQNVGIGITNPKARLHIADSAVVFSANNDVLITPGNPPVSGEGRRMMWYADKAAFRAGYVPSTEWDKNNIGIYSTALGYGTMANATGTTAIGYQSTASGVYSTAMGYQTNSKALGSFVIGNNNDNTDNPDPNNPLPSDRLFQIGNGNLITSTRSNALTVLRNGNVGIGIISPSQKLHIGPDGTVRIEGPSATGGSTPALSIGGYGDVRVDAFGIAGGRFIVKENGSVGIGNNSPAYLLDVNGRMRIRSGGTNSTSAGAWLNNNANTLTAFIGMEDDTHVGLYGTGAGWPFSMNTQTGALKINGNEGAAGQILSSGGSSAAPAWVSPTAAPYNNTSIFYDNSPITQTFSAGGSMDLIPGLSHTFTVSTNTKIIVSFNLNPYTSICLGCTAKVQFYIRLDGSNVVEYQEIMGAQGENNTSGTNLLQVGPGTHTIEIYGRAAASGSLGFFLNGYGFSDPNYMIIQLIPS